MGLSAVDHFSLWVRLVHSGDKRVKEFPVLLGIAPWIPVSNVLFVPQRPIVDAVTEMIHHPGGVAVERGNLFRRIGRPEHGIQAAVVVVERPWLRNTRIWQLTARRGIHRVSLH